MHISNEELALRIERIIAAKESVGEIHNEFMNVHFVERIKRTKPGKREEKRRYRAN